MLIERKEPDLNTRIGVLYNIVNKHKCFSERVFFTAIYLIPD